MEGTMLIIVFFGGLALGILLGVGIMSLLFLAQKEDKHRDLLEQPAAPQEKEANLAHLHLAGPSRKSATT